jgi:hypothetical protein
LEIVRTGPSNTSPSRNGCGSLMALRASGGTGKRHCGYYTVDTITTEFR